MYLKQNNNKIHTCKCRVFSSLPLIRAHIYCLLDCLNIPFFRMVFSLSIFQYNSNYTFSSSSSFSNECIHVLELPTNPVTSIEPDALRKVLPQINLCLLISNFSNPLGSCMPDEHKKEIVQRLTFRKTDT